MAALFRTFALLTLGGTGLALLLLALRYVLFRKMPSTFYYYAWLLVLLRFLLPLPGLVSVESPAPQAPAPSISVSAPAEAPAPAPLPASPVSETVSPTLPTVSPPQAPSFSVSSLLCAPGFWLAIWAAGFALSLFSYIFSYTLFVSEIRRHIRRPMVWDELILGGIPGRKPALWRCDGIYSPMLLGLVHPMIVLPEGDFEGGILRNILAHELMHYRRKDILYKWFAVLVFSVQWFNPITYLIRRELNRACELSCDEMLIRSMDKYEKQAYGETLLTLAASRTLPANLASTTFSTEKRNLKERLTQIMHYKVSTGTVFLTVLILAVLAGCGAAAGPRLVRQAQELWDAPKNINSSTPYFSEKLSETAQSLIIYEETTDTLLCSENPDAPVEPRQFLYLAFAMTALEHCDPSEIVTVSENDYYSLPRAEAQSGNLHFIRLKEGEQFTAETLLYTVVMENAADSALALAEHIAGSPEAFVSMMNAWVRSVGCTGTVFTSIYPTDSGQQTTARDLLKIIRAMTHDPLGAQLWSTPFYAALPIDGTYERLLSSGNALLSGATVDPVYQDSRVTGGVSACRGTEASLVCSARDADGPALLCVLLNADRIFGDNGWGIRRAGNYEEMQNVLDMIYTNLTLQTTPGGKPILAPKEAASAPVWVPAPGEHVITVQDIDSFLNAIRPNTTVLLEPGDYNLRDASNYGKQQLDHCNYFWEEVNDGFQLAIRNLENLTIRAASPDTVRLLAEPRYANVLHVDGCPGFRIANLTAGHTQGRGSCSGGVLLLENTEGTVIEACSLFGCGTVGVDARYCLNLRIQDSDIYDCSYGGINLSMCRNVRVEGSTVRGIGRTISATAEGSALSLISSSDCLFYNCTFRDSLCRELLYSSNGVNVQLLSCHIQSNSFSSGFWVQGAPVILDGCEISGNTLPGWFHSPDTRIIDREGNFWQEETLSAAVYEPISPETAEEPHGDVYSVSTVDELLEAISSNRAIRLAPGTYDFSKASGYGHNFSANCQWEPTADGYSLVIQGVENLSITAESNESTVLTTGSAYADVLTFRNCRSIVLEGLYMGQSGTADCAALSLFGCWNTHINELVFHASGPWALRIQHCDETSLYSSIRGGIMLLASTTTLIQDSAPDALYTTDCDGLQLLRVTIPEEKLEFHSTGDITRDGTPILANFS